LFATNENEDNKENRNGKIDLSNSNIADGGVYKLNGKWELYWNKLLKPENIKSIKPTGYISVPSKWRNQIIGNERIENLGVATYRIQVKLPEGVKKIGLKLGGIESSFKLFANSKEIFSNGLVSKNSVESLPGDKQVYTFFETEKPNVEFVLQVSNHFFRNGGISGNILIGKNNSILKLREYRTAFHSILFGCVLIILVYNLLSVMANKSSKILQALALTSFVVGVRIVLVGEDVLTRFVLSEIGWFLAIKLQLIFLALSCACAYHLYTEIFDCEFDKKIKNAVWIVSATISVITLVLPSPLCSQMIYPIIIMGISLLGLTLKSLITAALNNEKYARGSIVTISILLIAIVCDILGGLEVLESMEYTKYAMFIFLAFHTIIGLAKGSDTSSISKEIGKKHDLAIEHLKRKAMFFQNISHELRTPLTLILKPLQKIKMKLPNSNEVDMALKNADRLFRVVDHMLDYQKLEKKSSRSKYAPLNLASFLKTCCRDFTDIAVKKKIKFRFDLGTWGEILINGQIDIVEKIIFNYFSNALKHTSANGEIYLKLSVDDERVRIQIDDTGAGISKTDQKDVFKVFKKVEDSAVDDFGGTGIGLALVKKLTEEIGGTVGVSSKLGLGSSFWVEFPIVQETKKVLDILYVEDDEVQLETSERMLMEHKHSYQYKFAQSAEEARVILKKYSVKCIISDANLPNEHGVDFLSFASQSEPHSARVLITGSASNEMLRNAVNNANIHHVIYKPYEEKEFLRIIDETIEKSTIVEVEEVASDYKVKKHHFSDIEGVEVEEDNDKKSDATSSEVVAINRKKTPSVGEVLIVDDISDMRDLIGNVLLNEGYQVIEADNGRKALELIRKRKPDIVITDWMMPIMSGPELITEMKKDEEIASIPVILLTVKSDEESRLFSHRIGVNCYLSKPFDDLELSSIVKSLLQLKKSESKIRELNKHLSENILKRYLPPKLVDDILEGNTKLDETPSVKSITILFSDLCQFTKKSSDIGPRKMAEILNAYLTKMSKVIFDCGGNIDKFIGDSIMVIFGAPNEIPYMDQIQMAQRCSLKMFEVLEDLNKEIAKENLDEFKMRVGVHHGPAIVGHFGSPYRSDYTAIGPTVNFASRIVAAADENEIMLSEIVRDMMPDVECENAGHFDLKGVGNNIVLYKYDHKKV
jgi:signal transduction histidine kinase/class 3 adenylate cyclase